MDFIQPNRSQMKNWFNEVQLLDRLRCREFGTPLKETYDLCARNREQTLFQKDIKGHYGCVNAVEFSPHGNYVVSGGDDLRVLMWKTVDLLVKGQPEPHCIMKNRHLSNIFALGVSLYTERLYSAGNDQTLFVHDISTGDTLQTYSANRCFYGISIHPQDDNVFAAASEDGRVRIYDLRNSEECHAIKQPGPVFCGQYNPYQTNLMCVCGSKMGLTVYDHRMTKEAYARAGDFTQHAIFGDWSDRGDTIFCIRSKSTPLLFDLRTSNNIELKDPSYDNYCTVKSCAFVNSDYVMTGSDDWNIYIWKVPQRIETEDTEPISEAFTVLKGHRSIVNHLRYSRENNIIVSCGVEKILKIWNGMPINKSYRDPPRRQKAINPMDRNYGYPDDVDSMDEDISTLYMFDYYSSQRNSDVDDDDMENSSLGSNSEREFDGLLHGYVIQYAHHGDDEDYNDVVLSSENSEDEDQEDSDNDGAGFPGLHHNNC